MRLFILLIVGIFFSSAAYPDCSSNGLEVFPKGNKLKCNSIIILDGYGESQAIIKKLNKKYPIYLKSKTHKIDLLVKEIYVGQFALTQAVLLPKTQLSAGFEYELFIDNLPKQEKLKRYNNKAKEYESIKFIVLEEFDFIKPSLIKRPQEKNKSYTLFGCGPAMFVNFSFEIIDSSEIIVKTTVRNKISKIEKTYYVLPKGNTIMVGHGMCSGAFIFDENNEYEVEFSFVDASGNYTVWSGDRLQFTKPTDKGWDKW